MPVIGPFNRRVIFQKKTVVEDEVGQELETWVTQKTAWAHREDVGGSEKLRANQQLAVRVSKFTVRWFSGLNAGDWRIVHDKTYEQDGTPVDLIWDIEGIAEPKNTRRQYWELLCTAVRV